MSHRPIGRTMLRLVTTLRGLRGARRRRFARHYLEMVLVMLIAMMVLAPLWDAAAYLTGWRGLVDRPDLRVVAMATDMTVGMSLWMAWRGHPWRAIAEMGVAMALPFLMLLPPLLAGALSEAAVLGVGHVLMLVAMLVVMLLRPEEYTHQHGHTEPAAAESTQLDPTTVTAGQP